MTDFLDGYNLMKKTIEFALEEAVDALPSQIYSVELHRTDDGKFVKYDTLNPAWLIFYKPRSAFTNNSQEYSSSFSFKI